MAPIPISREIAISIVDVARMLKTYADQRARQFGISRAQWTVLMRLDRFEGLKQSELAEVLDLAPISLTRLLDRLAENGLIERRPDPNDRRGKLIALTDEGKRVIDETIGRHVANEARLLSVLTAAEQEKLNGLLGKLIAGL